MLFSDKIKQIENNPNVAIAGNWFTAHGKANNLGYFGKEENSYHCRETENCF